MELYELGHTDIRFIISAGPTREYMDPVRYVSNPSSGKMGYYLAMEALRYSPNVAYVHGPIDEHYIPLLARSVAVGTTQQMLEAIMLELAACENQPTVLIMAAAPADYRVRDISQRKIKKSKQDIVVHFVPNPDILLEVHSKFKDRKYLYKVGFAAESHDALINGLDKMKRKGLEMIVINDILRPDAGFQSDSNEVIILQANGKKTNIPTAHKAEVARNILSEIVSDFRNLKT